MHFFANEWRSSGGVTKQIVWEAGRGCVHALSDRYVASQLTALAPHIQHRRHNLEKRAPLYIDFFSIELCISTGTVFRLSWEVPEHRSGWNLALHLLEIIFFPINENILHVCNDIFRIVFLILITLVKQAKLLFNLCSSPKASSLESQWHLFY